MLRIALPCCIAITLISLASSYVPVKGGQYSIKPKEESAPVAENDEIVFPANVEEEDTNKNAAEELNHNSNTFNDNRQEQLQINKLKNNATVSHTENHHMNNGREEKHIFKEVKEHSYHDEVTIRNHVIYKHGANFDDNAKSNQEENEYKLSVDNNEHKVSMSNLDGKNEEHKHNEEFVHVSNKENPSKYHIEQHSAFDGVKIDGQQHVTNDHHSEDYEADVPSNVPEKVEYNQNNQGQAAVEFNNFEKNSNVHNSEPKHAGVHQQNEEHMFQQNTNDEYSDSNSPNQKNEKTDLHEDHVEKAGINSHEQTHKVYEENWRQGSTASTFGNFNKDTNVNVHNSEHKYHNNAFHETGHQSNGGSSFNDHNANSNINGHTIEAQHIGGYQSNEERTYQQNSKGFKSNGVSSAHKTINEKTNFHEDHAGKSNGMNSQERVYGDGKYREYQEKSNVNNEQGFNNKDVHYKNPKVVKIYEDSHREASLEKGPSNKGDIGKRVYGHKPRHSFHHETFPYYHTPVVQDPHHQLFEQHHAEHHAMYDTHHSDHYHHPHNFDHSFEDFDDYHDSHFDSHHHGHSHHDHEPHNVDAAEHFIKSGHIHH